MSSYWPEGIREEDVRVDVFRSGLQQPVTVRVTHVPTGRVATATGPGEFRTRNTALAELADSVGRTG